MIKVLFVCLGNICRSPMADGIFQQLVNEAGLGDKISVDSAGTGSWHVGERAHRGTQAILKKHGIPYDGRARQVNKQDMNAPNSWIIAMDDNNVSDLKRTFGDHLHLYRLLEFATNHPHERNVPDPYYTGGFDYVYELVRDGCEGLLAAIRKQEGI